MEFDINLHLNAIRRSVSLTEQEGEPAYAVTLHRAFAAELDNLWDATTNGERISRWFLPISGRLEVGGRFQLEGNAGGLITDCKCNSSFASTWEFGGDVSWVEVDLSEGDAGEVSLTLVHISRPSKHWDEFGPGATGVGWEMGLLGLAFHLDEPEAPKPDEAAFASSPNGKAFIAGSSDGWGRATVAAGTDPEAALAAAARTRAFYSGEPT